MSGRYDVKSGSAFLCDDVLGRNCILDVLAGGVLLRFRAAASTISVTLSRGDCLSWGKSLSGIRGCMLICGVVGDGIATPMLACGLDCATVGDCENTGGDLVASRLAVADEVIDVVLLAAVEAVVRPTGGTGVKILGVGKKLRQSS